MKAIILSTTGVIFEATAYEGADPPIRRRNVNDGQAVTHCRAMCAPIPVLVLTNEKDRRAVAIESVVAGWNKLPSTGSAFPPVILRTGVGGQAKLQAAQEFCGQYGIDMEQVIVFGHGYVDLDLMEECGFSVSPSDAPYEILEAVHFTTSAPGGDGAIEEFAYELARAKGINRRSLPLG